MEKTDPGGEVNVLVALAVILAKVLLWLAFAWMSTFTVLVPLSEIHCLGAGEWWIPFLNLAICLLLYTGYALPLRLAAGHRHVFLGPNLLLVIGTALLLLAALVGYSQVRAEYPHAIVLPVTAAILLGVSLGGLILHNRVFRAGQRARRQRSVATKDPVP